MQLGHHVDLNWQTILLFILISPIAIIMAICIAPAVFIGWVVFYAIGYLGGFIGKINPR